MKFRVAALIVLLTALSLGCGGGLKSRVSQPFLTDLQEWPLQFRMNRERIRTLSGKARLTIESAQYSGHVSVKTYYVAPDTVFLQAEGPLGIDVGKIFIGKNRFIFYNQYENSFLSADLDDPFLGRFLQTNVQLKDLKRAIAGDTPVLPSALRLIDNRRGVFVYTDGINKFRYIVNPATGLLEAWESVSDGKVEIREEFKNYREIDGVYVASFIKITLPQQMERISIFYKEMKVNKPVDPHIYTIEINPNVKQLNIN